MSRLKRLRVINGLVESLETIKKNQCSLSEKDEKLIDESIEKLNRLRKKKGLTNKHFKQETVEIVELINKFFNES